MGTVTNEIGKAIADIKKEKIDFKVDKNGIVHASIENFFDVEKFLKMLKSSCLQ